ncbi:MAG: Gfo/Idh/MocA family protein [Gammaproteobacteria bacterium]
MNRVRWGIVGPGRIAHTFATDMAYVDNATLQAVTSRSPDTAQAFAARYHIESAYSDYAAMLADPEVDAVYIATPHTCHAAQIIQACEAGKAVLCEKPLTVTSAECEAVMQAAQRAGVFVMEAMWTYFLPAVRQAHAWFLQGRVGKLVQIQSSFGHAIEYGPDVRAYASYLAGGCLLDMGVYPIALNWRFHPHMPQSVTPVVRFAPNGVEDDLAVILDYSDMTSTLAASFRTRLPNWTYVIGDEGYIALRDSHCARECFLHQLDDQADAFDDGRRGSGFEFQIAAASADILAHRTGSDIMPLTSSLAFQQIMGRIRQSWQS